MTATVPANKHTDEAQDQSKNRLIWLSRIVFGAAILLLIAAKLTQYTTLEVDLTLALISAMLQEPVVILSFGIVALLVLSAHPRHTVGWLLLLVSVSAALGIYSVVAAQIYESLPDGEASGLITISAWASLWYWNIFQSTMMLLIPLYFPTGRLLSKRWRPFAGLTIFVVGVSVILEAIDPVLPETSSLQVNPFAVPESADFANFMNTTVFGVVGIFIISGVLLSVILRYRRSEGVERAQMKWVVYVLGLGVGLVMLPGAIAFYELAPSPLLEIFRFLLTNGFWPFVVALPIAIGVSILQKGLYNIDIIINRSLVYGGVLVFLIVVFSGGFALMQALMKILLGSEQFVIAALLPGMLAAALFNPARRRLRRLVDKRLYGIDINYSDTGKSQVIFKSGDTRTSFGAYTGLEKIGSGGMGEVYRAVDPDSGKAVAIKILPVEHREKAEMIRRFSREAQTVEKLQHPNIVTLYRVGAVDDTPYMVMELVEGYTLSDLLDEHGPMSLGQVIPVLREIASALDYAHDLGIVHRDIKPSNIMIERGTNRAVLMDFGIARIATAMTQLTGTGGMVGTLDYISPEQIHGTEEVDGRADIYSLGIMVFQMLTGELPFKKANPGALVMAHLMEPPPDVCARVAGLPQSVCEAVARSMAKEPQERFDTAGEIVHSFV